MNAFDQMREAIASAKQLEDAAAQNAEQMASLLVGRLDRVSNSTLKKLKKELRTYNIHTGRWSNK